MKWATNQLGPARDLDVLAADVLKHLSETDAGEKDFADVSVDFTSRRAEAYATVRDFLRSDRFRKGLLDVAEWIEASRTTDAAARANTGRPVEEHAAEFLTKRRKQVKKKDEICTISAHGRVTNFGSEQRNYAT